ncbi:MAG: hypothetical protein M3373_09215 [Gemmatimonadota bacterium]|nr:hypothetical protein [Gemmatimonadota bacterium]
MRARKMALVLAVAMAAYPAPSTSALQAQRANSLRGGSGGSADARAWTPVRTAKWALLAAAVSFGTFALVERGRADTAYDDLRARCLDDPALCELAAGRYADETSERLYVRATTADRRARVGMIGGQVTLLGSAALFIYDLREERGPADIPYPSAASRHRDLAVGVRLAF